MSLNLVYITNLPTVAWIAEQNGVDRIMIDLESIGKEERQKDMNTVKSHHTVRDIEILSGILTKAEVIVRVNPWHASSVDELEAVIAAGADRVMLPMWKTAAEVHAFLEAVHGRIHTSLLLETKEAVACMDEILTHPLLEEIHIGLNDLHLSYGLTFLFEPLANGMVEGLCEKCRARGIRYGFGGIARIGEGTLPAERIIMEHYRLGSTMAILSRSFCNAEEIGSSDMLENVFMENMTRLREYEASLAQKTADEYRENQLAIKRCVAEIVNGLREKKAQ